MTSPITGCVVVHVHDADPLHHQSLLRNVRNLVMQADPIAVEIVTHGPGIDLLLPGRENDADILELMTHRVDFIACANTLASRGLTNRHLIDGSAVVPSGIAHLARRQWEGWAYLHP